MYVRRACILNSFLYFSFHFRFSFFFLCGIEFHVQIRWYGYLFYVVYSQWSTLLYAVFRFISSACLCLPPSISLTTHDLLNYTLLMWYGKYGSISITILVSERKIRVVISFIEFYFHLISLFMHSSDDRWMYNVQSSNIPYVRLRDESEIEIFRLFSFDSIFVSSRCQ